MNRIASIRWRRERCRCLIVIGCLRAQMPSQIESKCSDISPQPQEQDKKVDSHTHDQCLCVYAPNSQKLVATVVYRQGSSPPNSSNNDMWPHHLDCQEEGFQEVEGREGRKGTVPALLFAISRRSSLVLLLGSCSRGGGAFAA